MKITAFACLITVLVSLVRAHRDGPSLVEQHHSKRNAYPYPFVFLCNCWPKLGTNAGGTQSEVAFFSYDPLVSLNGSAIPDHEHVMPAEGNYGYSANYLWQEGGHADDGAGGMFNWTITVDNSNSANGTKVGLANYGSNNYTVYADTGISLYPLRIIGPQNTTLNLECISAYRAHMDSTNIITGTSALPTPTPNSTATSTPGETAHAPQGNPVTNAGLSLEVRLSIGVGSSIAVVMLLTLVMLLLRHFRQKRAIHVAGSQAIEMDASREQAELSGSMTAGLWSTPNFAVSELHPDTMMEMADTNCQLMYGRPPQYMSPVSPVEMYTEKYRTL